MILGLVLKLPLLPERPIRHSWTISVIFPTAVLAIGFIAIVSELGYLANITMEQEYLVALVVGVLTVIFSKFILEKILPRPSPDKSSEESHG